MRQAIQGREIQKGDRRSGQQRSVVEHIRLVNRRHTRGQQPNLRAPQFPAQCVDQIATTRPQRRLHQANPPVFSPQQRVNDGQKVGVKRIHKEGLVAQPIARDNGPGTAVVKLGVDQKNVEERRVNRLIEIGQAHAEGGDQDRPENGFLSPQPRRADTYGPHTTNIAGTSGVGMAPAPLT